MKAKELLEIVQMYAETHGEDAELYLLPAGSGPATHIDDIDICGGIIMFERGKPVEEEG
jgi:hypothetical protein